MQPASSNRLLHSDLTITSQDCKHQRWLLFATQDVHSSALSPIDAFLRSSATSASASFSCASSALTEAVPLTDWLAVAGFLVVSWVLSWVRRLPVDEVAAGAAASASNRSISFWARSMFCRYPHQSCLPTVHIDDDHLPPWFSDPARSSSYPALL